MHMVKTIIGIMGPGEQATTREIETAYTLGQAIAQAGWVLLTGGRHAGVMDAASRGAKAGGGMTIGILPAGTTLEMSPAVDIPIVTGMGHGRNAINVLTSQVIVACGCGPGTTSEIALALKLAKPLILMEQSDDSQRFWQHMSPNSLTIATTAEDAIFHIRNILL
jgi:uncharacterized protein (TIGR00725 family)